MTTFAASSELDFTSSLRETLLLSRSKLDAWVENEKAQADAVAERYRQAQSQHQQRVDTAVTHLLAYQLQGGLSVNDTNNENKVDKTAVQQQLTAARTEVNELQEELKERQARVQELHAERAQRQQAAEKASKLKARTELDKQTTIDDLTRGIVNYKYLGLDFEKAHDERLRFTFTCLDPEDETKAFSFLLFTNQDDKYEMEDVRPFISSAKQSELLEHLNETDDLPHFGDFIRGMRKEFQRQLQL